MDKHSYKYVRGDRIRDKNCRTVMEILRTKWVIRGQYQIRILSGVNRKDIRWADANTLEAFTEKVI